MARGVEKLALLKQKDIFNFRTRLESTDDVKVASSYLRELRVLIVCEDHELDVKKAEFGRLHNAAFLNYLLDKIDCKWYSQFSPTDKLYLFDAFFLDGIIHDSFLILLQRVTNSQPGRKMDVALDLLSQIICIPLLIRMFSLQVRLNNLKEALVSREALLEFWGELLNNIMALPEKLANKLKHDIRPEFLPTEYFDNIGKALVGTLFDVHEDIAKRRDWSVQFLCKLLSRCCVAGYMKIIMGDLGPFLCEQTQGPEIRRNVIWREVSKALLLGVEERARENLLIHLLHNVKWYGYMENLLMDAIPHDANLTYLLTKKLILFKYFKATSFLHNIFGYLGSSQKPRKILRGALLSVLEVWGLPSAVKYVDYEQHVYITKAILVAAGHLSPDDISNCKTEIRMKLMTGVETHLSSPLPEIRKLGMITAECLTARIDPDGPQLSFQGQYDCDEEAVQLKECLNPPLEIQETFRDSFKIQEDVVYVVEKPREKDVAESTAQPDLDSDDDLEPYDMSDDATSSNLKKPNYIRECMTGLADDKDAERFKICLETVETLIQRDPHSTAEVAVEVTKILLHTDNHCNVPNYLSLRHSALVSLAAQYPKQVAEYLGEQFYERNYNTRQRMDMLEVLVEAARQLGDPIQRESVEVACEEPTIEHVDEIIQSRLEKSSRWYFKSRRGKKNAVTNRMMTAGGSFFFPLVKRIDSGTNHLDLLGRDCPLMGKLVFSLGSILHTCLNTPFVSRMGKILLVIILPLKKHPEPFVRRSVLYALAMVFLTVPCEDIIMYMNDEMVDCGLWLQTDMLRNRDEPCRLLARKVYEIMRPELPVEFSDFDFYDMLDRRKD